MITLPMEDKMVAGSGYRGSVAVLTSPRRCVLRTREFPAPGAGQLLVRLEGCGVCGSNVPVWEGRPWFDYPREPGSPGHEGWGVVEAVGEEVTNVEVGQRVAALSYHAFATHDLVDARHVAELPAALASSAFPGEAIGCAINVFRRSGIRRGEAVAVVGVGFLGALLIQLATARGARVVALSRRDSSLATARQCGARETVRIDCSDAARQVHAFCDSEGCDCVIEATGFQGPLDVASQLVKTRGRLVIAGYHQDGPRSVDMQSWNWRGIDVINAHERDPREYLRGMRLGAEAVAAGDIRLADLITHRFPLSEVGDALEMAARRPDGFIKAWVQCS